LASSSRGPQAIPLGTADRRQHCEAAQTANQRKAKGERMIGAHFEISIDGKPGTYRDRKAMAE
jgi:hypothetical protein